MKFISVFAFVVLSTSKLAAIDIPIRRIACHFAAEALVRELHPRTQFQRNVQVLSIEPTNLALGTVRSKISAEGQNPNLEFMTGEVIAMMAGPVAQQIYYGDVVPVGRDYADARFYAGRLSRSFRAVDIDALIQTAAKTNEDLIRENRDFHIALVQALIEEKTLNAKRIKALLPVKD